MSVSVSLSAAAASFRGCSREEALELALTGDAAAVFASAARLREAVFGRAVELCAIINARSGDCAMDCRFCSQSRHNTTPIDNFPLLKHEALRERILELAASPVRHIGLVTSGGALPGVELERLTAVIGELAPRLRSPGGGRLCGSLGRLSAPALEGLHAAGLTRFHHNLETSESYYPRICTTQRWEDRLRTVHRARAAGLEICCGGLFGLGESWEDRVDFALRLRAEGVDNIPMNFLYPHPGTPLKNQPPLSPDEALRIIAVFRHILPQATLRVCGGRPLVLGVRQEELFAAGANALMTGNYLTTAGRALDGDLSMIRAQGLEVAA